MFLNAWKCWIIIVITYNNAINYKIIYFRTIKIGIWHHSLTAIELFIINWIVLCLWKQKCQYPIRIIILLQYFHFTASQLIIFSMVSCIEIKNTAREMKMKYLFTRAIGICCETLSALLWLICLFCFSFYYCFWVVTIFCLFISMNAYCPETRDESKLQNQYHCNKRLTFIC